MVTDEEGFDYPRVDADRCVDCGLCNKVCPVQNSGKPEGALKVYAARNRDGETRARSSSGGVFTLLAEEVIRAGGMVFGVAFDRDYAPVHTCTGENVGLATFRGSKYAQSRMGTSYAEVRALLKTGRRVLFSGTSCQVAGLKRYLGREYDNLLAVEILCHGVPSPRVWQRYPDLRSEGVRMPRHHVRKLQGQERRMVWLQRGHQLCRRADLCHVAQEGPASSVVS